MVSNLPYVLKSLAVYLRSSKKDFMAIFLKFEIKENDILLDAGCGSGDFLFNVLNKKKVWGIGFDINRVLLTKNKLKSNRHAYEDKVDFVWGDVHFLPFHKGCVDKIKCTEVLEHVKSDYQVCNELYRVLKQDGLCLVSVPTYTSERIISGLSGNDGFYHRGHKRVYTKIRLYDLVRQSGFNVANIHYSGFYSTLLFCLVALLGIPFDDNGKLLRNHEVIRIYDLLWKALNKLRIGELFDLLGAVILPKSIVFTLFK